MIKLVFDYVLDIIYPPRCMFCKDVIPIGKRRWVCEKCLIAVSFLSENEVCHICGKPSGHYSTEVCKDCLSNPPIFTKNRSLMTYQDSQSTIYSLKYGNHPQYAKGIAELMYENMNQAIVSGADCIIPVPLHIEKIKKRGYNQAALIAEELARLYKLDYYNDVLQRIVNTPPQSELNKTERYKNVAGAFIIGKKINIEDKIVILADDIHTTGATFNECSKTLISNGAKEVRCISFSITSAFGKR